MKSLYFTFDYELYMGNKTGSVEKCLIIPTQQLMKVFEKYGVEGTFFVDCAYLYQLNKIKDLYPQLQKDFIDVSTNLRWLVSKNQDIQMHFHPQWLYSDYDGEEWKLDFKHYKLSDVEPTLLQESFCKGRLLLEEIIGKDICAYRAGGYCLSDYNSFPELFRQNHIVIDSSVVPGKSVSDGSVYYDYSTVPQKEKWNISNDIATEDKDGEFLEVPVTLQTNGKFVYFRHKLREMFNKTINTKIWGDGQNIFMRNNRKNLLDSILDRIRWIFTPSTSICSIDGYTSAYLPSLLQQKTNLALLVSHPKCLSSESIFYLEKFLQKYSKDIKCQGISKLL